MLTGPDISVCWFVDKYCIILYAWHEVCQKVFTWWKTAKNHLNNNCLDILTWHYSHALVVKVFTFHNNCSVFIGWNASWGVAIFIVFSLHSHFYDCKTFSDRPQYLKLLYKSANTLEDALFRGYGLFSAADTAQLYLMLIASQACSSSCRELSLGLLLNSIICVLLDYVLGCQKRNKTSWNYKSAFCKSPNLPDSVSGLSLVQFHSSWEVTLFVSLCLYIHCLMDQLSEEMPVASDPAGQCITLITLVVLKLAGCQCHLIRSHNLSIHTAAAVGLP